jgi:hypothetical protein
MLLTRRFPARTDTGSCVSSMPSTGRVGRQRMSVFHHERAVQHVRAGPRSPAGLQRSWYWVPQRCSSDSASTIRSRARRAWRCYRRWRYLSWIPRGRSERRPQAASRRSSRARRIRHSDATVRHSSPRSASTSSGAAPRSPMGPCSLAALSRNKRLYGSAALATAPDVDAATHAAIDWGSMATFNCPRRSGPGGSALRAASLGRDGALRALRR